MQGTITGYSVSILFISILQIAPIMKIYGCALTFYNLSLKMFEMYLNKMFLNHNYMLRTSLETAIHKRTRPGGAAARITASQ